MTPEFGTTVMGRLAVVVTSTAIGMVGVLRLFGADVSGSVSRASDGTMAPAIAWSLLLIGSWLLVLAAVLVDRYTSDPEAAMMLERVGVAGLVVGLLVFVAAVVAISGFSGAIMVVALSVATIVNLAGRQVLLARLARRLISEANRSQA